MLEMSQIHQLCNELHNWAVEAHVQRRAERRERRAERRAQRNALALQASLLTLTETSVVDTCRLLGDDEVGSQPGSREHDDVFLNCELQGRGDVTQKSVPLLPMCLWGDSFDVMNEIFY